MLPQMMPLPWVSVFFMIFFCFFSICMLFNFLLMDGKSVESEKSVSVYYNKMPW